MGATLTEIRARSCMSTLRHALSIPVKHFIMTRVQSGKRARMKDAAWWTSSQILAGESEKFKHWAPCMPQALRHSSS